MQPLLDFLHFFITPESAGISTLIAGAIVLLVYFKGKFDHKKDVAKSILLEIQNAERQIHLIKKSLAANPNSLPIPDVYIMPNESWSKHAYLFVSDFKPTEWDIITDFYNNSKLYDEAVNYNKSFFKSNEQEIRVNLHKIISAYVDEVVEKSKSKNQKAIFKLIAEMNNKINVYATTSFSTYQTNSNTFYAPQKPVTDGKNAISSLNDISTSSIGKKFEKTAEGKFLISYIFNSFLKLCD